MVVDGSSATAVSKLRKAIGDEKEPIILIVPRVGYRLAVPVHCKTSASAPGPIAGIGYCSCSRNQLIEQRGQTGNQSTIVTAQRDEYRVRKVHLPRFGFTISRAGVAHCFVKSAETRARIQRVIGVATAPTLFEEPLAAAIDFRVSVVETEISSGKTAELVVGVVPLVV